MEDTSTEGASSICLVDEDDVVTSSGDRRDTENSNEAIIFSRKNLDRVSTPVTSLSNVRDANRLVFTSVSSSPSSSSGTAIKHGSISTQAIALSQAGGGVSIVQLQLPNQTNVVQSVIQPAHQQSVIQATGGAATVQTVQIPKNVIFQLNKMGSNSVIQSTENTDLNQVLISTFDRPEASDNSIITSPPPPPPPLSSTSLAGSTTVTSVSSAEDESKKRREVLERRPSYRKIFNELSSADLGSLTSPSIKSEDETDSESSTATIVAGVASPYLKVLPTSTIQLAQSQDGTVQGLQTLTMANAGSGGSTILQYAQGQDGQFFVPVTVSAAELQAYQIRTTGSGPATGLTQGVVMTAPTTIATSHDPNTGDAAKKRELRLIKNREAAKECRRKKKEYIKCLEQRVSVLENQNKALIEELKTLKNLYCQKE